MQLSATPVDSQGGGVNAEGSPFAYETVGCRMMDRGSPALVAGGYREMGKLIQSGVAIYTSNNIITKIKQNRASRRKFF